MEREDNLKLLGIDLFVQSCMIISAIILIRYSPVFFICGGLWQFACQLMYKKSSEGLNIKLRNFHLKWAKTTLYVCGIWIVLVLVGIATSYLSFLLIMGFLGFPLLLAGLMLFIFNYIITIKDLVKLTKETQPAKE